MAIEKCINEFDVDQVIFEEGSTGRELFVVLDGNVEIAKLTEPGAVFSERSAWLSILMKPGLTAKP